MRTTPGETLNLRLYCSIQKSNAYSYKNTKTLAFSNRTQQNPLDFIPYKLALWRCYELSTVTAVTKSAGVTAPNWAPIVAVKTPILWQLGQCLWHSHKVKKPPNELDNGQALPDTMKIAILLNETKGWPMNWGCNIINSPKASAAQKAVNHLTMEHHASKRKALKTASNRSRKVSYCIDLYCITSYYRIKLYPVCGNKCVCYACTCFSWKSVQCRY